MTQHTGLRNALDRQTGRSVMSASGDEVAFVIFGACIPWGE